MAFIMKTHQFYIKKFKIPFSFFSLIALFICSSAQALDCKFSELFTENVTVPIIGSGMVTVGEDIPVGKVLYAQDFFAKTRDTTYICNFTTEDMMAGLNKPMNTYTITEVISSPAGSATTINGRDVFPTNVQGISVVFEISGPTEISKFPNLWELTYPKMSPGTITQGLGQFSRVRIEFIKTGPIPPGTHQISASSLPVFQVTSGSKTPFVVSNVFVILNFSGSTTLYTKTCQLATPDIEVNLGSHWITKFSNPGSATAWKNFDIVLKDCPPFYGYSDYMYFENKDLLYETHSDNKVTIVFKSLNGTIDGNPLLAKINSSPNAAKGVGIELSQRDTLKSIPLDGSGGVSLLNLSKDENSTYTIPLKARYVQIDQEVGAGMANGSVVFTITYL